MLNLSIQHLVYLDRNQRYALHDGIELVVTGVSVPVWFSGKLSSEPACEVFCRYILKNTQIDSPIKILDTGYEITLPYRQAKNLDISDDDWRVLSRDNPDKLERFYQQTTSEVSSKNLLDMCDGGSGSMAFREQDKAQQGDQILNIIHFVTIGRLENLIESIE